MPDRTNWTDEKIDTRMGRLLQAGVAVSGLMMLLGAAVYFAHHWSAAPAYSKFQPVPASQRTIGAALSEALGGKGRGFIQIAVLLMIATPVARVVFAAYGFFRQRDWLYTAISLIVLSLLIFGLTSSV